MKLAAPLIDNRIEYWSNHFQSKSQSEHHLAEISEMERGAHTLKVTNGVYYKFGRIWQLTVCE